MEGKKEKKKTQVSPSPPFYKANYSKRRSGICFPKQKNLALTTTHGSPRQRGESRAKNGSAKKFAQWAHIPFPHPERQSARRKMALPSLSHILPSPPPKSPNPLSCTLHSRGEITNILKCNFTHMLSIHQV